MAHYEVGANGSPIPDGRDVVSAATAGEGLRLTLQRDIQFEAQQTIAAQVKATHALSGTVIVMNPRNGQILALAVAPTFDPNDLSKANAAHLGDPAVSDAYEPGSVIKAVTVSAALQNGLVSANSKFVIPNTYRYGGSTFHDAESHGTEHLTLTGILAYSSNIGAIQVAKRLGEQRLYEYLHAFGLGQPTGVGLPGESAGLLPAVDQWSATDAADAGVRPGPERHCDADREPLLDDRQRWRARHADHRRGRPSTATATSSGRRRQLDTG